MRRAGLVALILLLAAAALLIITHHTARQALVAGLALVSVGVPLLVVSRLQLGSAFSVGPRATTLVTRGTYSKIPHPMYTFLDLALLGIVIALRWKWLLLAWLALVAVHSWAARRESRVLERAFGEAYRKYRAGTWW
jgi:protein-S-isoprenylcysteine O-methyltransferase Ste14